MPNTKIEPAKKKVPKREKGFSVVDTSLRYIAMLEFIPRDPESVSVNDIIQALERRGFIVDKRSIQRDLIKLSQLFKLTPSKEGQSNRWSFSEDAPIIFFPSMDEHTAISFQLIQAYMRPLLAPETLDSIAPLFKKSAERLSQRAEPPARWQEKIHVLPLGLQRITPKVDPDVQENVYQALLWELPLQIHYQPRNADNTKDYFITPLGLVIRDYVSYVVAAMKNDGSVRQFALHRFKSAEIVDEEYLIPAGFNLAAYANENFGFQMSEATTLDLSLWMDKSAAVSVAECQVSERQTMIEQEDGSVILSAMVPNTLELRRWICSFGQQVEVLQPGYLRAEIAEEIGAMLKRYHTTPF